ncbi:MAG: DUF3488 domain-containing protein, partial [Planctomycetaceae bacterium]|nr:DUF3488 domain-containing protein [Planctomycetaceae bacterium]
MNAGSERRWQAARLAALFLVLVQCASLGLLEEGHLFATIMGGIACLSLVRRFQIEPQQAPHWMWFAALALIQAVKHRVAPEEINEQITFFNTVAAYEAARFLIFLQSVQLFVRRPGGRIPTWVAGIACLSMVLASNVRLNSETRPLCMALSLTFVGGLAIFAALNRRRATSGGDPIGRWLAGGALGLVLLAATGITHAFQRLEGKLERWLSEQAMFDRGDDATSGFSGRGQIGDITRWKNRDADRVALRVHSEQTPGYLRGMVFDDLRGRLWADTAEVRRLGEYRSRRLPASHNNERIYRLHPHAYEAHVSEPMEFWPETRTGDRLFLPMEAAFLSAAADAIVVNGHGLVIRTGAGDGAPYTAMLDTSPDERPLSDEDRRRYLVVNPHLQPQLEPFLEEIFGNAETSLEKTERLTGFFRQ